MFDGLFSSGSDVAIGMTSGPFTSRFLEVWALTSPGLPFCRYDGWRGRVVFDKRGLTQTLAKMAYIYIMMYVYRISMS